MSLDVIPAFTTPWPLRIKITTGVRVSPDTIPIIVGPRFPKINVLFDTSIEINTIEIVGQMDSPTLLGIGPTVIGEPFTISAILYNPLTISVNPDVLVGGEITPITVSILDVNVFVAVEINTNPFNIEAQIKDIDIITLIMGRTTPKQIKAQSQVPILYQITDHQNKVPDHVLARINENFKILEMTLNNKIGTDSGSIIDSTSGLDVASLVIIGIDAQKPKVNKRHGRLFYWAYDTEKLYVLRPNSI